MPRKVNKVGGNETSDRVAPPKTRAKRKDGKTTFRSPHPELEVVTKHSERQDLGAGSYSIVPPETALFVNMGGYGEFVCEGDVAKELKRKAADRESRHLPPKYVEVENRA